MQPENRLEKAVLFDNVARCSEQQFSRTLRWSSDFASFCDYQPPLSECESNVLYFTGEEDNTTNRLDKAVLLVYGFALVRATVLWQITIGVVILDHFVLVGIHDRQCSVSQVMYIQRK